MVAPETELSKLASWVLEHCSLKLIDVATYSLFGREFATKAVMGINYERVNPRAIYLLRKGGKGLT